MSDEAALLAAIVAEPDEDTPRLAYADWLDEHAATDADRARAEFIRVQIGLARLPDWGDHPEEDRRAELSGREKALLGAHWAGWARPPGPVPARSHILSNSIGFRRGFAEEGAFRADGLNSSAEEVRAYPLLRHLSVSALDVFTLDYLLDLPWLDEVRGLELVINRDARFGLPDIGRLADCRRLGELRALTMGYAVPITPDLAERFAANPSLAGVRDLHFWEEPGADAAGAMLSRAAFAALEVLEVIGRGGPECLMPALAANPRCATLARLRLNGYALNSCDFAALTAGPGWAHLRELGLSGGFVTPAGLQILSRAPGGRLESLSLRGNNPSDLNGLGGPLFDGLRSLDLSRTRELGWSALLGLADGPPGVLRHLDLSDCPRIGDEAAGVIAGSPAFAGLCQLELINTTVGPAGAVALAESPHLSDRLTLYLHDCPLCDRGQSALRGRFGDRAHW